MKRMFLSLVAVLMTVTLVSAQDEPYRNPSLSPEERAADLLSRLTLEEKATLMQNDSHAIPRLGIPRYNWWNESLHGLARNGIATMFPITMGMASTFEPEAVEAAFTIASDEARAKYHDAHRRGLVGLQYGGLTFWTPNVNIFRDPRWGRGHETYGEDPYLTSRMGVAVVRGLQGPDSARYDKAHACAKHYAVHSGPEPKRHHFDVADLDERDLWETYLPAFKALVQESDVKEVMCAYQRFDGDPCCGSNRLLMQILRGEWGYKHLVVSDCGAISDFYRPGHHETHPDAPSADAAAVISGTDVECGVEYGQLPEAVRRGLISEEQIDASVMRLLTARFALGEMDADSLVPWSRISIDTVDCATHRQASLQMARKSMVLLKNDGILPLAPQSGKRIVVMGPNASDSVMQWGNYKGVPSHTETILEGLRKCYGDMPYVHACDHLTNEVFDSYFQEVSFGGQPGFEASYWNNYDMQGIPDCIQQVTVPFNFNNAGATAFAPGIRLEQFSAAYKGIFVPKETGTYLLDIEGDDGYRVLVDGREVISNWGDHAAERRTATFQAEAGKEYPVEVFYRQGGAEAMLKFDIGIVRHVLPTEAIGEAADADVVIFVGGLSPDLEGEEKGYGELPGFVGGDRTTIELPQVQRELLQALHDMGKKVIYVNCSGSAVGLVDEARNCNAILQAWYPGQAGGTAVADILSGAFNPCGKLPVTFYKGTDQLPDFEDYSMQGRTYRYMQQRPLYPFGYGLSYTRFKVSRARLSARTIKAGEQLTVTTRVRNKGKRDGAEVVQVYLRRMGDEKGPRKTLRGFQRVEVKAGAAEQVAITLSPSDLEWFDDATGTMHVMPGRYQLLVGNSSDARKALTFTISE